MVCTFHKHKYHRIDDNNTNTTPQRIKLVIKKSLKILKLGLNTRILVNSFHIGNHMG
jgi:hypothetical protein